MERLYKERLYKGCGSRIFNFRSFLMGQNWAISIGINQYDNLQALNFAKRDAEAMAAWFREEAKFDQVFLFTENSPLHPFPLIHQFPPNQLTDESGDFCKHNLNNLY